MQRVKKHEWGEPQISGLLSAFKKQKPKAIWQVFFTSTSPLSKPKPSLLRPLMCTTVALDSGEVQENAGPRKRRSGPTLRDVVSFSPQGATQECSVRNRATFHEKSPNNNHMSLQIVYSADSGLINLHCIREIPLLFAVWSKGRARNVQRPT